MPHSEFLFPLVNANVTELKPCSERPEPLFWVCEVRFLSKFSSGSEYEIRRINFRKGLNIVWAIPPNEYHAEDEQRIAGHATGKTTLCRMIRYLLGESNYGNEQLREAIFHKYPEGYVVGHFRLKGIDWCVARPFAGYHGFSMQTSSIDLFLNSESQRGKYESFKEALSSLQDDISTLNKLPGQSQLTFYHLLPLFTRDQDSQYTKLVEWRDNSLSAANSPVLNQKSAMLVMRSLISGIVAKESELLARQEELEQKIKNAKSQQEILTYVLQEDRDRLRRICNDDAEDSSMDQLYITAKLEECKRRLSTYCIDQNDEQEYQRLLKERDNTWFEFQRAAEEYNAALRKYRQDKRNFIELKKMTQTSGSDFSDEQLDEIQTAAQQHPTRKYCCVPMKIAIEHHCPWAAQHTKPEDTASKENLLIGRADIQDKVSDRAEELKKFCQFISEEQDHVMTLKKEYEDADNKLNDFCNAINIKRNQRAAEEGNKLEAITRYQRDNQRLDVITTEKNQYDDDKKKCSAEISAYRNEIAYSTNDFSVLYNNVIRFVLGKKVVGRVKLNDGNIRLETSYHSAELQSAALDAVKNICFDIATMIYSVIGKGTHPRILIHDGPRVSDVTRSIYLGYFKLMHDIEIASNDNPNFQYIITTTEPPPEELQKEPWLICKLDATDTQSRLLKCNLE